MVKKLKIKKAFTVMEILLTMAVLGFVFLMTITNARKQVPSIDKARYKKAYFSVEQTVANLINDEQIYPSLFLGFKNTERAVTEFGEIIGDRPEQKFRDAFELEINPTRNDITCRIQTRGGGVNVDNCFQTDDGIVYGIPDTNFVSGDMQTNYYDYKYTYSSSATKTMINTNTEKMLPITVYTDWAKVKDSIEKQEQEAMYIGVQYNGDIRIFHPEKCIQANKHKYCKAESYLMSDTVREDG